MNPFYPIQNISMKNERTGWTLEDSISFQTRIIISVRKDKILRQIQENSHLNAWNADRDISDPNFPLGRSTLKKMTNLTYKYKKSQRPQSVCKPRKCNIHISHKIKMRHENNWKEHYENKSYKWKRCVTYSTHVQFSQRSFPTHGARYAPIVRPVSTIFL